jgi:ubiquinone/menaquinone biosynthesis C-methylase UbiE
MPAPVTGDFSPVTEQPGSGATRDQLARMYQRYRMVADQAAGKRVLEVGCGAGQGLGYVAQQARSVVGGDYTASLLGIAQTQYAGRIPLLRLNGHSLPFAGASFDLVVILEAIYYLENARQFLAEARRVLDVGGALVVGTVNKDWSEFAPSPFSTRYLSAPELNQMLLNEGFAHRQWAGGFATGANSVRDRVVSLVRRAVVFAHLMPGSLEARARFKRLFYGQLAPLPAQVSDGMAPFCPLTAIDGEQPNHDFKILYCVARLE